MWHTLVTRIINDEVNKSGIRVSKSCIIVGVQKVEEEPNYNSYISEEDEEGSVRSYR